MKDGNFVSDKIFPLPQKQDRQKESFHSASFCVYICIFYPAFCSTVINCNLYLSQTAIDNAFK